MVGIIDYGMGNLLSVYHALDMIGADVKIFKKPEMMDSFDKIILPGVGAFRDCIKNLAEKGFIDKLNKFVYEDKKPIMGICLGMQAMAKKSYEGGEYEGLGWLDAEVVKLTASDLSLRIPQIGWNNVKYKSDSPLFEGISQNSEFYFVHSYWMKCSSEDEVEAFCDYGGKVTAAVRKNNIFATQFHPEKSQDYGLKVLENFLNWKPVF